MLVLPATYGCNPKALALQVAHVQKLWDKMQELGLAESEASRFDTLQQLQSPGMPAETKEASRSVLIRCSSFHSSLWSVLGSCTLLQGRLCQLDTGRLLLLLLLLPQPCSRVRRTFLQMIALPGAQGPCSLDVTGSLHT